MQIRLTRTTLSDGSSVYDVVIIQNGPSDPGATRLAIPAFDRDSAVALASAINEAMGKYAATTSTVVQAVDFYNQSEVQ